ncbi:MerR family transcriptional regulator [Streptomyces sp. NPDC002018]|uniref:MerR family transcriptional regulator n=1 Tax=Streptomyces sp. NPDC002018 TaxID=3364629 RepID=UPI003696CE87
MSTRLTIGDFSRMTHMSVKTLRHYHQVGLLEPAEVDPSTGYRYYVTSQVPTAQVIRRFRGLDMPVEQVRAVLAAPGPDARNKLILAHLDRMQEQLDRTRTAVASLRSLLEEPAAPAALTHRTAGETPALAITGTVAEADLGTWWGAAFEELHAALRAQGAVRAGPSGILIADELFEEGSGTLVAFVPVAEEPPGDGAVAPGRVAPFRVPAAELAVMTHHGQHDDIDRTYGALGTYVAEHALGVAAPVREYYLVDRFDTADTSRWRTEIGWPVFRTTGG